MKRKMFISFCLSFFILSMTTLTYAASVSELFEVYTPGELSFCESDISVIFQAIGYVIVIVKILLPIIIMCWTIIDLMKIVLSGEMEKIKESSNKFVKRLIAAVVVFFVPTALNYILLFIGNASDVVDEFSVCQACVLEPNGETCEVVVAEHKMYNSIEKS